MAKSEAEKKAAAHEYYIKYRKKGMKKGRKKGKKGTQTGLLGVSASGLNSDGIVEAAAIKDRMKKEMNEALKKAKTDEEKLAIRKEYAKKANAEIAKLKADPKFAKAKAEKKTSTKTGSKSSGSKGSSSKGSSGGSSGGSGKSSSSSSGTKTETQATTKTTTAAPNKDLSLMVSQVQDYVTQLSEKLSSLTDEQRAKVKQTIQTQLDAIRERIKKKG